LAIPAGFEPATQACDAINAELGYHEADDLHEKLYEPISEIVERMKAIEPKTILGLQAKAKMPTSLVLGR